MSPDALDPLTYHLSRWADAYGGDLCPPAGTARARPIATPQAAPPAEAPTAEAPPAAAPSAAPSPTADMPAAAAARAASPVAHDEPPETKRLRELRDEVAACTRCNLCNSRQYTVFGEGNHRARTLFVGEGPGVTEDQTGRPFVGAAGQLLDRIIQGAMGLQRSDVYIANLVKCHPPGNRDPQPDEVAACLPYLQQQIATIRPEVIVCLGRVPAQNLLATEASVGALRGAEHSFDGIPVVVTWHPAYLLRQPVRKRDTWEDIKRVNRLLGLPEVPPARG